MTTTPRRISYYDREIRGRVETGPVQFGDDWPGVFLRGDNAVGYGQLLREVVQNGLDPMSAAQLQGLADILLSCAETPSQTTK